MTDSSGRTHRLTMPAGKVQPQLWTQQKAYAAKVLSRQFSELVAGTKEPFVQAITDALSPQASFFNHKVLLVGDALADFRPHATASMSQAAKHALLLEQVMEGGLSWEEMCELMIKYARGVSEAGIKMGESSQFRGQGGGKGWFSIPQAL
jgi:predicted secreted acid phosphatase